MLPVGGGGGGGGAGTPDAPTVYRDGGHDSMPLAVDAALIDGRVCLVVDSRHLGLDPATDCASTGAAGLTVRLGDAKPVTTADNGAFTIGAPSSTQGAVWSVTGSSIVSSYMPFSDYQIPAVSTTMFDSMTTTMGVILLPGQGSIMAQVVSNGHGAQGKAAVTSPTSEWSPVYDGSSSAQWSTTSTGSGGVVWAPGLDVGTATITVGTPGPPLTNTLASAPLPIVDGGITFVFLTYP